MSAGHELEWDFLGSLRSISYRNGSKNKVRLTLVQYLSEQFNMPSCCSLTISWHHSTDHLFSMYYLNVDFSIFPLVWSFIFHFLSYKFFHHTGQEYLLWIQKYLQRISLTWSVLLLSTNWVLSFHHKNDEKCGLSY